MAALPPGTERARSGRREGHGGVRGWQGLGVERVQPVFGRGCRNRSSRVLDRPRRFHQNGVPRPGRGVRGQIFIHPPFGEPVRLPSRESPSLLREGGCTGNDVVRSGRNAPGRRAGFHAPGRMAHGSSFSQEPSLNQRSVIFFRSPEPMREARKFCTRLTRSGSPSGIATPMGSNVKGASTVVNPFSL